MALSSFAAPLSLPGFRPLAAGAAGSAFGTNGELVVTGYLVFQLTGSSAWVGASLALYFAPMLLAGILGGVLADRFDRRRVLIVATQLRALLMGLLTALVLAGFANLTTVLTLTALSGMLQASFHPAQLGLAFDIGGRGKVVGTLGLLNVASRVGQLLGAILAGWILSDLGPAAAYLLLAVAHFAARFPFTRLPVSAVTAGAAKESVWDNLRAFVQEARHNRTLLTVFLVTACVEIFGFSYYTLLPELAAAHPGAIGITLGWMHGARSIGGIVGGLSLAAAEPLARRGLVYLFVIAFFGISLSILAAAPSLVLTLAALATIAALSSACDVLSQSLLQLSVPDALRGRAMGAWVIALGIGPIGHLELGFVATLLNPQGALFIHGTLLFIAGILAAWVAPRLRKL